MNAIEAMNRQGKLTVTLTETKRELILEIADTGPGMDRTLRMNAFDPFYTTKRTGHNFGLGLPYALHVMRKHKGTLHMRSKKGEGTTFYLSFPKQALQAEYEHTQAEERMR